MDSAALCLLSGMVSWYKKPRSLTASETVLIVTTAEGGARGTSGQCENPAGQEEVGQWRQPGQGVTRLRGGGEEEGCSSEGGRAGEVPDHCP